MNNKLKRAGINVAEVVIVIAILILINFLGYRFFTRFDFTENKQYTISQATKDVLAGLSDPVNVDFYLSKDLPPQLISVKDEIRDKMAEFTAYSAGKFRVRYVDPGDDTEAQERAANQGIQELSVQVLEKDSQTVKKVYFGLVLNYEDKSDSIPIAVDPTSLEYELTSRLVKLGMDEKPKVGLFVGTFRTSEQQQGPTYQGLTEVLGGPNGLYEIVQLDAQADRKLPEGLSAVIIMGAFGMSDSLKYSIDQFMMNGGQVIVGLDPMMQAGQQAGGMEQAFPSLPTIEDQLEKYGVAFNKKLIVDPECAMAAFSMGIFTMQQPYLLFPKITPKGFNPDIAAVSKLETLVMPWTCPLTENAAEGTVVRPLASTTEQSFLMSSPFNLGPEQDWAFLRTSSEEEGPFVTAYLVEGDIPSAFPGPPAQAPPPPAADGSDPITLDPDFDAGAHLPTSNGEGRLVVMSSASALADNFLQQYRENVLFLMNTTDMLVLGDQLLGIRSAPVTARPIDQLTDAQKAMMRWGNLLGMPILLVLMGLLLWFIKGRRRRAVQTRYSS